MNALDRDRVRSLQLMVQAMKIAETDKDTGSVAGFYQSFAGMWLINRYNNQASWELQALTDIGKLPDYEDGYAYWDGETRGAAVDIEGNPVFYKTPASFESAINDGERWRWCLMKAVEKNLGLKDSVLWTMAGFFRQQFGVQTMASYGWWGRADDTEEASGTYAVHTLADDESIAKLATGIRRFHLPDEFNYIKIYKTLAVNQGGYRENALQTLADIYTNRRMYQKAAAYWQQILELPNLSKDSYKGAKEKLAQIVDNWGQFEPVMTQPHQKNKKGKGATVEFRFRNAKNVDFEAYEIKVPQLLADVKAYIKRRPNEMDWQKINVDNIGWRLVENNEQKYLGKKAAGWSMALTPRENHWDRRVTVETPLKKAGAYLLKATLAGGHTSRIVIWLNNTVIVQKPLDKENMYFVADAVTGEPLSHINLEFFGYKHENVKWNFYKTEIKQFAAYTDTDGLVMPEPEDHAQDFQWLITASGDDGRIAYLGFNSVWYGNWYDQEYNQTKVFTITDRPVYRPGQPVKFKQWIGQAKYDQADLSVYANKSMTIEILNPKGDRVYEKSLTADAYGGIDDKFEIPSDATLGVYQIYNRTYGIGGTFRVEEYKKPEFEVTVKAPTEPVMLGETITAEIKAAYYFGEPVKEGKVKYKVLRYEHSAQWFPAGNWDWFYDPGYWWFAYDYAWYPGWKAWGCFRPWPWWIYRAAPPPEVVAENETDIPKDGILKVSIDTRPAKEMHGDKDHRYEITAEVTDLSRRTIVGKGQVLVARQPFKVYAWVDRGHYRAGDTIGADFSAITLDNQPVRGKGVLTLFKVFYDKEMQPTEKPVATWNLDTDAQGRASRQLTASAAGQYRLSYTVTDATDRQTDHKIEGGYVFSVMGDAADRKNFRFDFIELVTDKREYGPGEKVRLRINTDRENSTVALFVRPANGVYLAPKIIRIRGKSTLEEISITQKDMPNFFVEALTISDGKLYSTTREIIVPPEKRVLNLEVTPSSKEFKPGEKAVINIKLTDTSGEPFVGSAVVTVYDKALEYISGGSNVPDIRKFFWKWRRSHQEATASNLNRYFGNLIKSGEQAMENLGVFGHMAADMETDELHAMRPSVGGKGDIMRQSEGRLSKDVPLPGAAMQMKSVAEKKEAGFATAEAELAASRSRVDSNVAGGTADAPQTVASVIRKDFADAAFWAADIITDETGSAQIKLTMPDNLTGWKVKTWAMGFGAKVAEAESLITTKKNLMVRLQAPRFFIEKDEVVLSANVHNYLKTGKSVKTVIEMEGDCLELMPGVSARQIVDVAAGGEKRLDWRVKVVREGTATIRMKALTDEESDAMEMAFPVYVHGADKMEAWSGYINPETSSQSFTINVPKDRRTDSARLEIRYSPTLAGAMVDALPYLADYPYGCTEQTLSRFLPTVITQKILLSMGLDLKEIEKKRTNLNAQEIGDDKLRAGQWKKDDPTRDAAGNLIPKNPVFDEREV
ncbi:MAG: MG2 domain-containing protein, partial [Desulfosalsimonadaceae bacterium]|nr:MG2 domain-containing protein [Desulfosalsimonadaceae bacterium]